MEGIRFADVLFILLVCAITFGILALVGRTRSPNQKAAAGKPDQDDDDSGNKGTDGSA